MHKLFDLQLFADTEATENTDTTTQETVADNAPENTASTESTPPAESKEEIPAELAGLDEDTAREIMAEASKQQDKAPASTEAETQEQGTESTADADSDNKHVDNEPLEEPNQTIPYKRFKEVNDKAKAAAQETEQLKAQLEKLKAQQPATGTQPPQLQPQQQQIVQPQHPPVNAALAAEVNKVATQTALQMTGMTKADLDSLEFADENDPKVQAWKGALELARARTWNAVDTEFNTQQQQRQQLLQVHNQVLADYNAFSNEQSKAADFAEIQSYAVNDLFSTLQPLEKQTLAGAWQRVERQVCSPQDVMVVKNYYTHAAAEYRKTHPVTQTIKQDPVKQKTEKIKQMEKHPRSTLVSGSNNAGPALTVEALERMVQAKDWDDIPHDIQTLILNGSR